MRYLIFSIFLVTIVAGYYTANEERAYIQLTKKHCLGKCPVYDLFIYTNGKVVYEGIDHVTYKGKREFTLSKERLNEIKALVEDLDIEVLQNHTYKKVRDSPITNLIINNTKLSFQGSDVPKEVQGVITVLENLVHD